MPGPAPKPVALKLIEGNPSKRRLPKQPKFAPLDTAPPDFLGHEAKLEWQRLIAEWNRVDMVKRPDRSALIALCIEWDRYLEANAALREGRPSRIGGKTVHQVARESLAALLTLWARFGMTPADRARLDMPEVPREDDPVVKLLD